MEEYLTVEEIAKNLKVRKETVLRWIKNKELKATKIVRSWRISETDFEEFMSDRSNKK